MGSELEEGLTISQEAFSYKMGLRKSANAQPINGTISQSQIFGIYFAVHTRKSS